MPPIKNGRGIKTGLNKVRISKEYLSFFPYKHYVQINGTPFSGCMLHDDFALSVDFLLLKIYLFETLYFRNTVNFSIDSLDPDGADSF